MSKKILVVDDEAMFRDYITNVLERIGYTITQACDGLKAMDILEKYKPDLVLLDVNMPGMSGHEVCKRMRADDFLKNIPIVLVTSCDPVLIRETLENNRAEGYLAKPFNPTDLTDMVSSFLD